MNEISERIGVESGAQESLLSAELVAQVDEEVGDQVGGQVGAQSVAERPLDLRSRSCVSPEVLSLSSLLGPAPAGALSQPPAVSLATSMGLGAGAELAKLVTSIRNFLEQLTELVHTLANKLSEPRPNPPASTPPPSTPPTSTPPTSTPPASNPPPASQPPSSAPPAGPPSGAGSTFQKALEGLLAPNKKGEVTEAQVFAALVIHQLKLLDPAIASAFQTKLDGFRKNGSYIDTAAKKALAGLVSEKKLTADAADKIRLTALRSAQLDSDLEKLSGRGGGTNPKTGKAPLAEALKKAEETFAAVQSGKITLPKAVGIADTTD